jgi:acetyltransferase
MKIQGEGIVRFGNYFHSGEDCRIITDIHNFDFGTEIPYDSTKIVKDVIIGDFVWIGTCVIILGGVEIGEGAIIQAVLLFLIFRRTQLLEELQQRYLR